MPAKLAFMTVGVMREPVGHAQVQGFIDRAPGVYAAADRSDGFHARSIRDYGTWLHSWGEMELPDCYPMPSGGMAQTAMTLSLWSDLESVAAFSYNGAHAEALKRRREWFDKSAAPEYVAWWVEDDQPIDWKEGKARLDHLHNHGSSAFAFNFKNPFDANGNAYAIDRESVKAKAAMNAAE
jgi:hypothetical protein